MYAVGLQDSTTQALDGQEDFLEEDTLTGSCMVNRSWKKEVWEEVIPGRWNNLCKSPKIEVFEKKIRNSFGKVET